MNRSIHIFTLEEYEAFVKRFPEADTINRAIFDDPAFRYLTYNYGSVKENPLWKVTYITSEGIERQTTEKQFIQFILRYESVQHDLVARGVVPDWHGLKIPGTPIISEDMSFDAMLKRFIPEDNCIGALRILGDKFYSRLVENCNGLKIDSKNFENQVKNREILRISYKPWFEMKCPVEGYTDKTQDELVEISNRIYQEETEGYNGQMTTVGRTIVNFTANERFEKLTGWTFGGRKYDPESTWFDPVTLRFCKYVIPDFCKKLCQAAALIYPGSSTGIAQLKSEEFNPLAQTREYRRGMREGLNEFKAIFNIDLAEQAIGGKYIYSYRMNGRIITKEEMEAAPGMISKEDAELFEKLGPSNVYAYQINGRVIINEGDTHTFIVNGFIIPMVKEIEKLRKKRRSDEDIYNIAEAVYQYYTLRTKQITNQ